jgi:DNA-binding LytR/AlgR family response regulator
MESPLRMSLLDENVRRQHFIQCHKSAVVGKLAAAVDAYEKLVKK